MNNKVWSKILSISFAFILVLTCINFTPISTIASSVEENVLSAASTYVKQKKNSVTREGLLTAVRAVEPAATLSESDFYIQHSIPGVTDTDTTSGYPLNIEGSDGAVVAVFEVDDNRIGVSIPLSHDKQVIEIKEVAIAGISNGFTYSNGVNSNIIGYSGNANKIVVPADYAGTIASANGTTEFPGVEVFILANQKPLPSNAFANETDVIAIQMADGDTVDGTGTNRRQWREDGSIQQFKDCTKLKYVRLPLYINVPDDLFMIGANCFLRTPALENVRMPIYAGGYTPRVDLRAFEGSGVRELLFGLNPHTPSNTISALPDEALADPAFGSDGTRNVNFYTTEMSFVRAVALVQSKIAQLDNVYSQNDIINMAKTAITGSYNAASLANSLEYTIKTWKDTSFSVSGVLTIKSSSDSVDLSFSGSKTLLSLDVGYPLTPAFDPGILQYSLEVQSDVTSLTSIKAETAPGASVGTIIGNDNFSYGTNIVKIPVTTADGNIVTYELTVKRINESTTMDQAVEIITDTFMNGNWTNRTTTDNVKETLQAVATNYGYTVKIEDYYIYNSIPGAMDGDKIMVPGHNGYIAVVVKLEKGTDSRVFSLMYTIKPYMKKYNFASEDVSTEDEFILTDDGKVLEYYTGDAKKIIIPDGVEEIVEGWYDGKDAGDVIALIIPDSVKTVPYSLCYAMGNLEVCRLSDGITEVMGFMFENCWSLQYVKLPSYATKIGGGAFKYTVALESLYIPNTVKRIEANAFWGSSVREVTLSKNVEFVGDYGFAFPQTSPGEVAAKMTSEQISRIQEIMNQFNTFDRVVTVLNPELSLAARAAFGSDQSDRPGSRNVVRASEHTTVFQSESGRYPYCTKYFLDMDMTLAEAAARAQVMADKLSLTDKTTGDSVLKMITDSYYSTQIDEVKWTEDLNIATDGKITGVLRLVDNGNYFDVSINTVAIREENGKEEDDNPDEGDDNNDEEGGEV